MDGCMLQYYTLKKVIASLPEEIKSKLDFNDNKLFNYATFNDLGVFYKQFNPFKADKYAIHKKMHSDKFYEFFTELAINTKRNIDFDDLLLLYATYSHKILDEELNKYLSCQIKENMTMDEALNLLDYYYSIQNENVDISENPVGYLFYDSFVYSEDMDNAVKGPIARAFGFFNTDIYFLKCMNRKKFFYQYVSIPSVFKKIIYKLLSPFSFSEKKKSSSYLLKKKKSISSILNNKKKAYTINNVTFYYSFDDIMNITTKRIIAEIEIINDYLFYNKDKQFRLLLNLDKRKSI